MQGAFIFLSTIGLPLSDILFYTKEKGLMIDWIDFAEDALKDGWKFNTIFNKLETALVDAYGKEFKDRVLAVLTWHFKDRM